MLGNLALEVPALMPPAGAWDAVSSKVSLWHNARSTVFGSLRRLVAEVEYLIHFQGGCFEPAVRLRVFVQISAILLPHRQMILEKVRTKG